MNIERIIIAATIAAGLAWASSEDWREAQRSHLEYCENVRTGYWPDYRMTYSQECTEHELEAARRKLRRW